MSLWMFLKTFADVCLYFSIIAAFPTLFSCGFSFLWPALLCGVGAGTAAMLDDRGRGELRFLGLVLPGCALVLAQSVFDGCILAPVILYTAILIIRGEFALEYYTFREFFTRSLTVWGIFFGLLFVIHNFELMSSPNRMVLSYDTTLWLGLLYVLAGVLLLRQLRLGEENQAHGRAADRRQLAVVAVSLCVMLLGIVALERFLRAQGLSIEEVLATLMKYLVGLPLTVLTKILTYLLRPVLKDVQQTEPSETAQETEATEGVPMPVGDAVQPSQSQTEMGFPWWLVVLILVALTVALVFMFRVLRTRSTVSAEGEKRGKVTPAQREKRGADRSNRGKVRRTYREFLKSERRRGLKLRKNQTSADILKAVSPATDPEAASRLRELYLAARYDDKREVTAQQVKQAREALKRSGGTES